MKKTFTDAKGDTQEYTDEEFQELLLNPDRLRKELQGHLDAWINDYKHFLSLADTIQIGPSLKSSFYINEMSTKERYLYNQLTAFQELGVDLQFDQLDRYDIYKPLMNEEDILKLNQLYYPVILDTSTTNKKGEVKLEYVVLPDKDIRERVRIYLQSIFDRQQREHLVEGPNIRLMVSSQYVWPTLEETVLKINQQDVNDINNKCLTGVEIEGKHKHIWKEFEITGRDLKVTQSRNYSRYQTRWFDRKFKDFYKTKDSHFTYVAQLLKKRGAVKTIELMSFMIVPRVDLTIQVIHHHLLTKITRMFKDWFHKKYEGGEGYVVEEFTGGSYHAVEQTLVLRSKDYDPSQPSGYMIRDQKVIKKEFGS